MAKEAKDIKTNAMRILDSERVAYRVNTYTCEEFHDGLSIARMLGQDPDISYKTLVAKGRSGEFYVFVIPVAEELDLKAAARAVSEKAVELIPVKEINKVTGYIRGGCSPIGMKKPFVTVLDETACLYEEIIISGGRIGSQILLSPDDLLRVARATYADILMK